MTRALLNAGAGIPLAYANRHGLITGATGTGKTVSLMRLAEQFNRVGVPVFVADVKGDIAALARSCPADLVDMFGTSGRQIRVTFDAMGADLVARALELSDVQSGALEIAFAYARDTGLPLHTVADMRACLNRMIADRESVSAVYGQAGAASVGVIMRALLRLESEGARQAFGSPAFDVAELMSEPDKVTILAAERLIQSPRLYGAFLLYMLGDLWQRMPELGDESKPRLVLFFDESHLLFSDCSAALLRRIEQTVRLIRSKGIGVYFVSQSAADVPEIIRAQLAHTIAHDRTLPVGTARVRTMTLDGRPAAETLERVALPDCPLGPLELAERPRVPASVPRPAGQFDGHGYAFLAIVALVLGMLAIAIWQLWQAGAMGAALAIGLGALAALRKPG